MTIEQSDPLQAKNSYPALPPIKSEAIILLDRLLNVPALSGHENPLADIVRSHISDLGYEHTTDTAGNVCVRLPGKYEDGPLCCLAAHMDEIGMVVSKIEDGTSLRVIASGGLHPWKLGEGPVEIVGDKATVTGVLSMGSTHGSRTGAPTWDEITIITGLGPQELVQAGVRPGSPVTPLRSRRGPIIFGPADDPLVGAWTFDDRMGVVTLLRLLGRLKEEGRVPLTPTLVAFTVSEEIGGLGAKLLAQREQPDIFIAVDGSPIPPGTPLTLDGRPGIWVKDRLATYTPELVTALSNAAIAAGTEAQPVAYTGAASDASLVASVGGAAQIACFGHVRENSHGYEVARVSVFDRVLDTLSHFVTTWPSNS